MMKIRFWSLKIGSEIMRQQKSLLAGISNNFSNCLSNDTIYIYFSSGKDMDFKYVICFCNIKKKYSQVGL